MSIAEELLFSEWRVADRQARLLEQALALTSLAALDGKSEPPSQREIDAARRLRETANDLFDVAMAEMAGRAALCSVLWTAEEPTRAAAAAPMQPPCPPRSRRSSGAARGRRGAPRSQSG